MPLVFYLFVIVTGQKHGQVVIFRWDERIFHFNVQLSIFKPTSSPDESGFINPWLKLKKGTFLEQASLPSKLLFPLQKPCFVLILLCFQLEFSLLLFKALTSVPFDLLGVNEHCE